MDDNFVSNYEWIVGISLGVGVIYMFSFLLIVVV